MDLSINDKLYKEIVSYCELNGLDTVQFINDLLKKSFMIEKYGEKPGVQITKTTPITTEVVVKQEEVITKENEKETQEKPKIINEVVKNDKVDIDNLSVNMDEDLDEEIKNSVKPKKRRLS